MPIPVTLETLQSALKKNNIFRDKTEPAMAHIEHSLLR